MMQYDENVFSNENPFFGREILQSLIKKNSSMVYVERFQFMVMHLANLDLS
jgi:hypothetical protein